MDYKSMSDFELANVMINYINRVSHLYDIIAGCLDGRDGGKIPVDNIRSEYRMLKNELRADADYLDLVRNKNGSKLYMGVFAPSIREASAWGFTVPVNSAVNFAMLSAVEEARYKLTKHYSLEQWENIVNS